MPALRVLLAEDDAAIRELLTHHLEREGFEVHAAADGQTALRGARESADIVLLDVGLPVIDGFEIARRLRRERAELPILIVTARGEEIDRVVGFELGADDYVCKPFSPREVVSRVKAIARRAGFAENKRPAVMTFDRLEIDERARDVRVDGVAVKLKPREYTLLVTLASDAGIAFSRRALLERVWGMDFEGEERTVDVHVGRLRRKLEEYELPPMLETVHGYGYKFRRP